jgi:hypothetical protein
LEKWLISGARQGKNNLSLKLCVLGKVRNFSYNDGDISKEYRSQF